MPHGLAMARALDTSLTVVRVLEPPRNGGGAASTNPLEWEMRRSDALRNLDRLSTEHGSHELPIRTVLLEGPVSEKVCDWVAKHGAGLAVLCSHGKSGWTGGGLASTAKRLVERLSCSTLLVPASVLEDLPETRVVYDRVLVPLDGSPTAEAALATAIRVARAHGSELTLAHVVPVPQLTKPEPLDEDERELERRLIERNTRVGKRYLEALSNRLTEEGLHVTVVLAHDDVRFELLRCIREQEPDLIVISGHGQGGETSLRLGSVASFLLEHALAPTLVARDEPHGPQEL